MCIRDSLDITDAVATTTYTQNGVEYRREIFASAPDQVIVIRLTASKKGTLTFDLETKSLLHFTNAAESATEIAMRGKAPAHTDPNYVDYNPEPIIYEDSTGCRGMRYELRVKAINKGGEITADKLGMHVQNADEVTLYVSAATSFNGFDKCPDRDGKDEVALATEYLNKAIEKPYETLKDAHTADYKRFFDRVSLHLNNDQGDTLPTDQRLKAYTGGASDPAFETPVSYTHLDVYKRQVFARSLHRITVLP